MNVAVRLLEMCLIQTTLIISEWMRLSVRLLSNNNGQIRMNDIRIEADAVEFEWILSSWSGCSQIRMDSIELLLIWLYASCFNKFNGSCLYGCYLTVTVKFEWIIFKLKRMRSNSNEFYPVEAGADAVEFEWNISSCCSYGYMRFVSKYTMVIKRIDLKFVRT